MSTEFDLSPTQPLSTAHFKGDVARRFLISYPCNPDKLAMLLPPGVELWTDNGNAWISACYVRMKHMRPCCTPEILGIGFQYLIFRTVAYLPFPDGQTRRAVLVLQPNIDSSIIAPAARITTGMSFNRRNIQCTEEAGIWRLTMKDGDHLLFDAEISKLMSDELPSTSSFSSLDTLEDGLLGLSYGGEYDVNSSVLRLFAETHDPWQMLVTACRTNTFEFVENLLGEIPQADHVASIRDVPHYFSINAIQNRLSAPQTLR